MSGVKGMKGGGGARPNTGGAREGAGRPPGPKPEPLLIEGDDMLKILQDIACGRLDVTPTQLRAAIAAVQYTHTKTHDGGKKELQAKKAEKVSNKFSPTAAPLKLVNQ